MIGKEIAQALLSAQKEMGEAVKDSKNPFFKSKYADLNAVREAVIPALNKYGVSVLQPTQTKDGKSFVVTTLLHTSGESFVSETEIICSKQNDPQALGSAISYARRYGLQSLMCVGSTDDDGEAAMGRQAPQQKEAPKVVTSLETTSNADTPKPITATVAPVRSSFKSKAAAPKKEVEPERDPWA